MKKGIKWIAAMVAFCVVIAVATSGASAEIKFGILPRLGAVELYGMFSPLAEYLSRQAGEKVSIMIPRDFAAFKAAVKAGQIDIGFANSLIYVQLREKLDLEPLAVSSEKKAGTMFRGIIVVRKDSGIEKLRDLKGKKLVFVDEDSAAGYIFQMLLLSKAGLNVHEDFITLPFAKKHDTVTMAVVNGAADAGGIREDDLEKMKSKVDLSKIKIVGYTDYYPNWPLFAAPRLSKDTASKIRAALLKLRPRTAGAAKILGPAKLTGFTAISDRDYDMLRRAAKLVGAL